MITTYHQLFAIERNKQYFDPNRGYEFSCNNNHDGLQVCLCDEGYEQTDSFLKDAF